jgi:hypothetical protein
MALQNRGKGNFGRMSVILFGSIMRNRGPFMLLPSKYDSLMFSWETSEELQPILKFTI